jgi:hypothetical protein
MPRQSQLQKPALKLPRHRRSQLLPLPLKCQELYLPMTLPRPKPLSQLVSLRAFALYEIDLTSLAAPLTSDGPAESAPTAASETAAPAVDAAPEIPVTEDTTIDEAGDSEITRPETNGATTLEKKPSISKRKSSTGVPEHKGKKLNKKKSMPKMTNLDAEPGDYFLARLKGYPPWPSIIADEEMLPDVMINGRPVTTKKADGNYNEAYADGGKKVNERTFPIMFLHTNELRVLSASDLTLANSSPACTSTTAT